MTQNSQIDLSPASTGAVMVVGGGISGMNAAMVVRMPAVTGARRPCILGGVFVGEPT